jgi:hypothetical protein
MACSLTIKCEAFVPYDTNRMAGACGAIIDRGAERLERGARAPQDRRSEESGRERDRPAAGARLARRAEGDSYLEQ